MPFEVTSAAIRIKEVDTDFSRDFVCFCKENRLVCFVHGYESYMNPNQHYEWGGGTFATLH